MPLASATSPTVDSNSTGSLASGTVCMYLATAAVLCSYLAALKYPISRCYGTDRELLRTPGMKSTSNTMRGLSVRFQAS